MTPTTRRPVRSRTGPHVPAETHVDGDRIYYSGKQDDSEWPGTDDLLASFLDLAPAEPEEMASWIRTYGVPELCGQHGRPDRHRRRIQDVGSRGYCPMGADDDGRLYVAARNVRRAARALGAVERLGIALRARLPGNGQDWTALQFLITPVRFPDGDDWRAGRARLADYLTDLLRDCGVTPAVEWRPLDRVAMNYEADGLLGVLAILLARGIAVEDNIYRCDSCGFEVPPRKRPPRPGEGVYCDKVECRRKQQRLNQARSRARQKGDGDGR